MKSSDISAMKTLDDIERSEKELLDLFQNHLSNFGSIGYQHIYLFGIAKRALSQSAAFKTMINEKNTLVACSILRLQLDTVLRLYALFWVEDAEDFARQVWNGAQIDRLKAADGEQMKDKYLRDRLISKNPWISSVYSETSGFIHFSARHMKSTITMADGKAGDRNMISTLMIGPNDADTSISYYGEILRAFRHLNMMIPVACKDWLHRISINGTSIGIGELN